MFPSHRLCSTPPRRPRGHPLFEWRLGRAEVCIEIKKRPGPRFATPHGDSQGRTGTQSPLVRSNPPISPKPEPTHRGTDPPRPLWLSAGRYIVCKHPMVTLCIIPFLGILHVSFRGKKNNTRGVSLALNSTAIFTPPSRPTERRPFDHATTSSGFRISPNLCFGVSVAPVYIPPGVLCIPPPCTEQCALGLGVGHWLARGGGAPRRDLDRHRRLGGGGGGLRRVPRLPLARPGGRGVHGPPRWTIARAHRPAPPFPRVQMEDLKTQSGGGRVSPDPGYAPIPTVTAPPPSPIFNRNCFKKVKKSQKPHLAP